MSIVEVFFDSNITGDCLLQPIKKSVNAFGYTFSEWTDEESTFCSKLCGLLKRVANFVMALIGTLITALLVPFGLTIKFFARCCMTQSDSNTQPASADQISSSQPAPIQPAPIVGKDWDHDLIQVVRPYPGDLTQAQKSNLAVDQIDRNALKISFAQQADISVTIRNKNLFDSEAEVIVNAANTHLGGGGGIDGAIHAQGGTAYANAHRELQTKYNAQYVQGHSAIIDSGALKQAHQIDNVIVVAGPQGPKTTPEKENDLYSCYYNSLVLAHNHNKASIAFPTISTGIFNFPKDRAASISLRAIHDFIAEHPNTTLTKISIHFLANDPTNELEHYRAAAVR